MSRRQRLQAIVDTVSTKRIRNQAELAEAMRKAGHKVTQPTLSRDIAELGLVKGAAGYSLPDQVEQPKVTDTELRTTVRRFVFNAFVANNFVMIKTFSGSASVVAWALDRAGWEDMIGTIAGDDTVLLMAKSVRGAEGIGREIKGMLGT